ncbi:hypothetical protein SVIOM74S_06049 [Streptomyces violarus]
MCGAFTECLALINYCLRHAASLLMFLRMRCVPPPGAQRPCRGQAGRPRGGPVLARGRGPESRPWFSVHTSFRAARKENPKGTHVGHNWRRRQASSRFRILPVDAPGHRGRWRGPGRGKILRRCIVATGPRGSSRGSLSLSARPRPVRYSSSKDAVRPRRLHQLGRSRTWWRPGRGVGVLRLPRYDTRPAGWGVELVPPINATCHAWRRSGFLKSRLGHEITDRCALSSTDRV